MTTYLLPTWGLEDLQAVLVELKVERQSTVMVHSSLIDIGKLDSFDIDEIPRAVSQLLLNYLGPNGTLCAPAGNWDYGLKRQAFDVKKSPVSRALGALARHVAADERSIRSYNPIFSIAAIGRKADFICRSGSATAMGVGSAWDRLFQLDAEMLFIGCDLNFMSFARYIESRFGVPYLYNKLFDVPVVEKGSTINVAVVAPLRFANLPIDYDLSRFEQHLFDRGMLRKGKLGAGEVRALRMGVCFEEGVSMLAKDIHFFLAKRPPYQAGVVPFG